MARQGFRRNARTISHILKTVDGGKRAVAEQILAGVRDVIDDESVRIDTYTTDRDVAAVVIPADIQAKYGAGTKAVNRVKGA